MRVLVICPTWGRIPYLGRMLASFLSQTYVNTHLVIINDDKNVKVDCKYDNVTCINVNSKLLLDCKRNIGACFGDYDIIMPLDDDDVFLPDRINNHVYKFIDNPGIGCYRNSLSYILYGNKFKVGGNAPNAISYTKAAYHAAGGYSKFDNNSGGDTVLYDKLQNKLVEQDPHNMDFVYNFGGVNYHLTCIDENKLEDIAYAQLVKLDLLGQTYTIEPNYAEFAKLNILSELYQAKNEDIEVVHNGDCNIDISHLI